MKREYEDDDGVMKWQKGSILVVQFSLITLLKNALI